MRTFLFICFFSNAVFAQQNILVMGNYKDVCLDSNYHYNTSDSLPEALQDYAIILLFSNATSALTSSDVKGIVSFVEQGGGLYIGAENWPLQAESNQITHAVYKKTSFGVYNEPSAQVSEDTGNLKLEGIAEVPAGTTTVAFPMDHRLRVEAWIEDQPLILSGNYQLGRIIIDGGYSRFYCDKSTDKSQWLFSKMMDYLMALPPR